MRNNIRFNTGKTFSLTFVEPETNDIIVPTTDFTLHAPKKDNYWKIDTSKCKGASLEVIQNTANRIKFQVNNIRENYEFVGFSMKQHYLANIIGISFDWEKNIIMVDALTQNERMDIGLFVNCIIDAYVVFEDPHNNPNKILLNNEFKFESSSVNMNGIKNDHDVDVVAGQQYHLHVDTKNYHIEIDSTMIFMFGMGNFVDVSSFTSFVPIDDDNTNIFINGIDWGEVSYSLSNVNITHIYASVSSLEEFKNTNFDIVVTPLDDRNNCDFNLFLVN